MWLSNLIGSKCSSDDHLVKQYLQLTESGTRGISQKYSGCSFQFVAEIDILFLLTFQPDIGELCIGHVHILKMRDTSEANLCVIL